MIKTRRHPSFLTLAWMRSRSLWTRWRQASLERKLAREQRRLLLLAQLQQEQRQRVQRLHLRLAPTREAVIPEPTGHPLPVMSLERMQAVAQRAEQTEQTEQTERPEPVQEIAQLLGLPPLPRSRPSSAS